MEMNFVEGILFVVIWMGAMIYKGVIYSLPISAPCAVAIYILILKSKKIKNKDIDENKKIKKIQIILLIICITAVICGTLLGMGIPIIEENINKPIIEYFFLNGKQEFIEKKLEKKYNRDFTFVSKSEVYIAPNANIFMDPEFSTNYMVDYRFKDEDGVTAIVKYKPEYAEDYYESKRSKYEIENAIYEAANKENKEGTFFVEVKTPLESIMSGDLDKKSSGIIEFIKKERKKDEVYVFAKENSNINMNFLEVVLEDFCKEANFKVGLFILTDTEYNRLRDIYNSSERKEYIEGSDYESIVKFEKIHSEYKYL